MKRLFVILYFSCMCAVLHGRPPHITCGDDISVIQSKYSISFGDAIEAGVSTNLSLSISWKVFPQVGVSKVSGTGQTTGNLIFTQPGKYQITFHIPSHGDHPAKTETVIVEVSSVKMIFDIKDIKFSKSLTVGEVSGVIMTVPVKLETYDGKTYDYSAHEAQTTGVAKVSLRLKNGGAILKDGVNELTFELSGVISQNGNIQFRFYDSKGEAIFFNYLIIK